MENEWSALYVRLSVNACMHRVKRRDLNFSLASTYSACLMGCPHLAVGQPALDSDFAVNKCNRLRSIVVLWPFILAAEE